jgi:eukaryotic-like serine/threonine-protein kinase
MPEPPDDDLFSKGFNASRFRFIKKLGAGGFGVVYLVRDLKQGGDVALKTLQAARPEQMYRLKREFRSLFDLRHKNLVCFYELFVEGEHVYFTMEYVPGSTFLQHVRQGLGVDGPRLRDAISQLATGLSVLHQAGKLHRDVKPSNVLVTPEDRVVLLDFGLATEIEASQLGKSIEQAGTPAYMSPEQALGEPLTAASDWYSVGVMLYQALTGRLPFPGSGTELMAERLRTDLPSPRELDLGVPKDLSELCMSLLAREPGRRSGAEELLAVVGEAAKANPPAPSKQEGMLFGRKAELEQLEAALVRLQTGEGVTVLVDGTSGVGKTSLVEHFLTRERPRAAIVLRGRCYEREQVPYQGIDSLIDDVCRLLHGLDPVHVESVLPRHVAALVRLFPVLERVPAVAERSRGDRFVSADERETRRQAFGALRELLARIADHRTLIVHIDDLQWGDLDTAGLLRDVLRPPDAPIMLLILAYRREDQERSPCLKVLAQEPIGTETHVHLGPLSSDAADALMRELLKSKPGNVDIARLVQEAEGNPFLLEEVARFWLETAGDIGSSPADIHAALRARIDRLPPAALELLQTVAVAGHPVTEVVAQRAAALAGSPVEGWHRLVGEHLVRFSGPPDARLVETFHDRGREAVLASMSPQRVRACHRGLATALEQADSSDPEVLARHHESAGNPERALEFTVEAAAQATKALAFARAASLLQRAVDFEVGDPAQRLALLISLGEALANAGRCIDSANVYLAAADAAGFEAGIPLRRRAANQLLFAGRINDARDLIQDDLRAQGFPVPRTRRQTQLSLLWFTARMRWRGLTFQPRDSGLTPVETLTFLEHLRSVAMVMSFVGLPWLGAQIGTRFVLRALEVGDRRLIALGISLLAAHAGAVAPFSRRTRYLFETMTSEGRGLNDRAVEGTFSGIRGLHAYFEGDWRGAVQHLDGAERDLASCQDRLWELSTARHLAIWSRFFLGEWNELQRRVFLGLADARDRGNAYGMAGICSPFGVAAWLSRDDPEEARRTLEEVSTWSVKGFPVQRYWFLMAESLVQLYVGDGLSAWEQIRLRWRTANVPGFNVQLFHLRGCCALAAAERSKDGAKVGLVREAEWAARRLQRIKLPHAVPMADLLWAGIAAQRAVGAEASKHLAAAISGLERQKMPVYAAAARRRRAQLSGESERDFLPGQDIVNPEGITRMLVPGFRVS